MPRDLGCRNHGQSLRQLLCSREDEAIEMMSRG
jgi:hypothetical protein